MNIKAMRVLVASAAVLVTMAAILTVGVRPGLAVTCGRVIGVDPQVTAAEGAGTLTLHSN